MQSTSDPKISKPIHRIGTFQSLVHYDYRWLFIGSTALYMAMNMQMISRGWLILRLTNDSPLALAMVMVAFAAPMALLAPVGGALADRGNKKRLIMGCMLVNTVMTLLLATLDMLAIVQYWHLLAIGVVNGTMMAINVPSRQSLIADVIPRDLLMNAISLNNSGMNLARIVGPALAGVLIIFIDTWGVFYIISLSYLLSAFFMLRITPSSAPKTPGSKSFVSNVRKGFAYVARHGSLRAMMLILLFSALCQFGVQSLLPVWAKNILHAQSDGLGYLVTISGFGALVGSLFVASHSNIKRKGMALIVFTIIAAASTVLLAFSDAYESALPILFVNGLANAIGMSLTMTLIQLHVDEKMRGRVLSISMMMFSMAPLGVAPLGAMAERFGTPAVYAFIGLGLLVFSLLFVMLDRQFREL
jgi:MFS family permease